MYKKLLEADLKRVIGDLGFKRPTDIVVSIPENPKFGDYSSNIPLQLAKQEEQNSKQSALEIASEIIEKLSHPHYLERVEIAGPGFLNFFLKDESLVKNLESKVESLGRKPDAKKILIEYAHPNTHKAFHIGHFRNISTGESISRLQEMLGNEVFRVTYGGDIGPHVAKAIWGILHLKDDYQTIKTKSLREKAEFLGKAYAFGAKSYEESSEIKNEIDELNKKLYSYNESIKDIWEETKNWSIGYFETIYSRLGTEFDSMIWESEIEELGSLIVEENLGTIFVKDQGAIIFPGEKYGLHNRVFITSAGYPTYEGKEMGLTRRESEIFPYDLSLHIVANEQESFFEVTTKALELVNPSLKGKKRHVSYGMVNLSTGKMSSRKGEVITAEFLIDQVKEAIKENFPNSINLTSIDLDKIAIAAIKFNFLKYSLHSDIAYDVQNSVSLQGDTGPYVQYVYARINSLLQKAPLQPTTYNLQPNLDDTERDVLRQLEYFEGVVEEAGLRMQPNLLTNYLLNLSKSYNLFYERFPIIGSDKQDFRLKLSTKVAESLKLGLYLLGIETLEKM